MRTNRTVLAGVLALTLTAVPGAVTAQGADDELATPSHWTSTETMGDNWAVPGGEVEWLEWGPRTTVGLSATIEADDPRASGDMTAVFLYDRSLRQGLARGTGFARLVNEGGSFQGPLYVVYYPDNSEFRMALMEGQDGYEGLSLVMTNFLDGAGNTNPQGLIWEGDLPALPSAELLPD